MTLLNHAALVVLTVAVALPVYAYVGYPSILGLAVRLRRSAGQPQQGAGAEALGVPGVPSATERPRVSIVLAAYNEEDRIRDTLESLLALDYPPDKRQIVVVSDASTDRTDAIVDGFADRGVELLRLPERAGKTAAENAALPHLRGDVVVNTDASVSLGPSALRALVARFADPSVGVVSGRDVSVGGGAEGSNTAEGDYVGYEMRVRGLESRVAGIVGASGCLYAIRADLHRVHVPEHLSRDFMAALTARERGFRSVSADDAVCLVPRASSIRREHRRKVRTMVRGMQTLLHKRHLLNPVRHGRFAWMLLSHKVCRWLAAWSPLAVAAALLPLAPASAAARLALAGLGLAAATAAAVWYWPGDRRPPRVLAVPAYLVLGNLAACRAAVGALRGASSAVWEPTRRPTTRPDTAA